MDGGCANVVYAPNNNIDTTPLIPLPVDRVGVVDSPMDHDQGGIYRASPFGIPSLEQVSDAFGTYYGCISGGGYLDQYTLQPPAVASPTTAFVTYMEAQFIGVSVTVYDKVGATATTSFPDLRVAYTTSEEATVAP